MIPSIPFDFNFDWILSMIFISYIIYGYFSGGHKQIRISINLILPFMIIYYLGKYITSYLYIPLSDTFLFQIIDEYLGIVKNTLGMSIAYIFTYILLFVGIFFLSIYARRYLLNENMRAKLGIKNNYLGAVVALVNGYVLSYFIILPVFSLGLVDSDSHVTNFVLEHPPPFSRIARTAEKAVPIRGLADKAEDFQQLLSVEGIEGYYNDAIYEYQQLYIGSDDSYEESFMEDVYPNLSTASKTILINAYDDYFDGETLTATNYTGVSRVLVEQVFTDKFIYEDLVISEGDFQDEYAAEKEIYDSYVIEKAQFDEDLENYLYTQALETYETQLEAYLLYAESYLEDKLDAVLAGDPFTENFTMERPTLSANKPSNYKAVTVEPTAVLLTDDIRDAYDFVIEFQDKEDVRGELGTYGKNFIDHKGLLIWYVDELDREMASTATGGDISEVIVSFKANYETIMDNINDEELEGKLYLAQMSITSYDVFTTWLVCTEVNIEEVPLEELHLEGNRCDDIDPSEVVEYDFTDDALGLIKTLFEGESVSWIILQYKYDYEAGVFEEYFTEFEEVNEVLDSTKGLVDDYDEYYKDIANSIDGNVSMVIKIAISVMKYNFDVYETLEDTPLMSAMVNDAVRLCSNEDNSPLNIDVMVCNKTEGSGGLKELFNMEYLSSEVLFKAYIMVDDENEKIIYDSEKMTEFLDKTNTAVEDNVITAEVVTQFGDQFAFHVIDETNNYTLLEQMYDEGQITIEAMRILADDDHELFSEEFRQRVRSLIR